MRAISFSHIKFGCSLPVKTTLHCELVLLSAYFGAKYDVPL